MSFNKKDNKLDFRNVKVSQFDPGQTSKMVFSELQSAYRSFDTNAILKDAYTHFIQELDSNTRPTKVTYYQATAPATDRINVRADVAGDLAGTYITLQEYISKKTHVFWFSVSGAGVAPGIGDVEHEVVLINNDPASLVAYSLKNSIETTDEFFVVGKDLLSAYVDIQYMEFGETIAVNVGTTGFLVNRLVEGDSFEVGEICLSYDANGNPIYNGNTLKGLQYNAYTASFDVSPGKGTTIEDGDGDQLEINPDGSLNVVPTKEYDEFTVTARDSFGNITQVEYYLLAALVKTADITYDVEGCLVSYVETKV